VYGPVAAGGGEIRPIGHVRYVSEGGESAGALRFLVETLSGPVNAALLAVGALVAVAAVVAYERYRPAATDLRVLRETFRSYEPFLPWLLRLAVGLPLVGSGFAGYLFTPAVRPAAGGLVRLFGVTLGFCLLFGLATRAVAGVGLVAYLGVLAVEPDALLAAEYAPAFAAIVLLGPGRPSADHMLSRVAAEDTLYARFDPVYRRAAVPFAERIEPYREYAPTVLRAGLGVGFVYLGVTQKLLRPGPALAVAEKYNLTAVAPVDPALWVVGAGLTETVVGLALIAGVYTRGVAAVAFLLFTATLFGLPDDPVLAHTSLFGLVSALLITGSGPLALGRTAAGEGQAGVDDAPPAD
jgi:uncharacterized membrane protein YphA (DoxX/SURF4 family)